MFARDRELLVIEPSLVRDVGWAGQKLVSGTGDVSGTTLTMTAQDVGFDVAGVGSGFVVVVGGVVYEVLARLGASSLTISRMRGSETGATLPPSPVSGAAVEVMSYGPQIGVIHEQLLMMVGIDPQAQAAQGVITEAEIVNGYELRVYEALGALHLVYAAVSALVDENSPAAYKAKMYRQRFASMRGIVVVKIDTDGDGVADVVRRPSVVQLVRV